MVFLVVVIHSGLVYEIKYPGYYVFNWNAKNITSGIYFYKLTSNNFVRIHKCTILK